MTSSWVWSVELQWVSGAGPSGTKIVRTDRAERAAASYIASFRRHQNNRSAHWPISFQDHDFYEFLIIGPALRRDLDAANGDPSLYVVLRKTMPDASRFYMRGFFTYQSSISPCPQSVSQKPFSPGERHGTEISMTDLVDIALPANAQTSAEALGLKVQRSVTTGARVRRIPREEAEIAIVCLQDLGFAARIVEDTASTLAPTGPGARRSDARS
jgi:hypothetical protein